MNAMTNERAYNLGYSRAVEVDASTQCPRGYSDSEDALPPPFAYHYACGWNDAAAERAMDLEENAFAARDIAATR